MILDSQLMFVPSGAPLSLVAAAGQNIPSFVIDLLGSGVGTAPANIIGTATVFGEDLGIGHTRPLIEAFIGTAVTTGTGATLNVAFQGAPDPGAAGSYNPTTWTTYQETGLIAVANLTAGAVAARMDWPAAFPANTARPRFVRLLFQVPAATNFTAGTISAAVVTMTRDDQANRQAAKNFTV